MAACMKRVIVFYLILFFCNNEFKWVTMSIKVTYLAAIICTDVENPFQRYYDCEFICTSIYRVLSCFYYIIIKFS